MKPENVEIVLTGRGAPDELKRRRLFAGDARGQHHAHANGVDAEKE